MYQNIIKKSYDSCYIDSMFNYTINAFFKLDGINEAKIITTN